jgi:hypothetical protein
MYSSRRRRSHRHLFKKAIQYTKYMELYRYEYVFDRLYAIRFILWIVALASCQNAPCLGCYLLYLYDLNDKCSLTSAVSHLSHLFFSISLVSTFSLPCQLFFSCLTHYSHSSIRFHPPPLVSPFIRMYQFRIKTADNTLKIHCSHLMQIYTSGV